jgi:hypothetical protein
MGPSAAVTTCGSVLGIAGFRWLSLAVLFQALGFVGEQVVLGWIALELTDSAALVGVAFAVRTTPFLITGVPGGVLADRIDRAWLLQVTNLVMAIGAAALGILALTPWLSFWPLLLLTFAVGSAHAINFAARQGQVHDLAGPERLISALAITALAMRGGGLLGSLGAGVLITHLGGGSAYFAIAVSYLTSAAVMRRSRAASGPWSRLLEPRSSDTVGMVAFMRRNRTVVLLAALTAAAEIFGFSYHALLPSLARDVLHVGPTGLGAMTASRSVGGMLAIATFALFRHRSGAGRLFLGVLVAYGGTLVLLGLTRHLLWALLLLALLDATAALSDVFSQSLIQLAVPAELRGRAGGLWVLAVGSGPIGQMQAGLLASIFGVPIAFMLNGGALMLMAAMAMVVLVPVRRL